MDTYTTSFEDVRGGMICTQALLTTFTCANRNVILEGLELVVLLVSVFRLNTGDLPTHIGITEPDIARPLRRALTSYQNMLKQMVAVQAVTFTSNQVD